MELITRDMPRDYVLIESGDYHYGALNCARESVLQMIDKVHQHRNYYLANMGDSIEAILPNDKRYAQCSIDAKNRLLTPGQQKAEVVKHFKKIRSKIVAWGLGNHEYKLINTDDFGASIASELKVPYGSGCYKFIAIDKDTGKLMHKFFMVHGAGRLPQGAKDSIQRMANRKAALRRKLEETGHSDCVVMSMGHTHQLMVVDPTVENQLYLTDNGRILKQHYHVLSNQDIAFIPPDSRWYCNTGSFLRLYSPPGSNSISYAEMAMYGPSELGWVEIHVQDGQVVKCERIVC